MGVNRTHLEHTIYSLAMQAAIGLLTGDWWAGAAAGAFFFLGREHAQREYKLGDPSKLKGYEAFDFWRWSLDSLLDMLAPIAAVLAVMAVVTYS